MNRLFITEHVNLELLGTYLNGFVGKTLDFGIRLIACVLIYWIGRKIIRYIDRILTKVLSKKGIDQSIASFLKSMINIILTVVLIITIINRLGVDTTSFVAILASAGIAIGMALSGNLQNFAGGVIILLFKPFRIGDYILAQGQEGTVKEINILNTKIITGDNRGVYIPNGGLSGNVIINYNNEKTRRIDLVVGIDYGTDYDYAQRTSLEIIREDKRILDNPSPFVAIKNLSESSVDILIRVWVKRDDYWDVYFNLNERIYKTFNDKGIGFPFPQMTVHLDKGK
ncbi:MAG: mechanosensitive ion channel [Dysgonamonadaceae bacterium]|jgi:small conductance mechanosensitive channel|nr:mechanosensitive ion channel [Dysgonamonadaceae bacterium]